LVNPKRAALVPDKADQLRHFNDDTKATRYAPLEFMMRCDTHSLQRAQNIKFYSAATRYRAHVCEQRVVGRLDRREVAVRDP